MSDYDGFILTCFFMLIFYCGWRAVIEANRRSAWALLYAFVACSALSGRVSWLIELIQEAPR